MKRKFVKDMICFQIRKSGLGNSIYRTCERKPTPELFEREVLLLKEKGVFDVVMVY